MKIKITCQDPATAAPSVNQSSGNKIVIIDFDAEKISGPGVLSLQNQYNQAFAATFPVSSGAGDDSSEPGFKTLVIPFLDVYNFNVSESWQKYVAVSNDTEPGQGQVNIFGSPPPASFSSQYVSWGWDPSMSSKTAFTGIYQVYLSAAKAKLQEINKAFLIDQDIEFKYILAGGDRMLGQTSFKSRGATRLVTNAIASGENVSGVYTSGPQPIAKNGFQETGLANLVVGRGVSMPVFLTPEITNAQTSPNESMQNGSEYMNAIEQERVKTRIEYQMSIDGETLPGEFPPGASFS